MSKKLFLIIGAPGSGKTTDAELIAQKNENITHYSTGDMLRAEVASGSKLGVEINTYISQGLIVPIDIAITTITNAIAHAPTEVVILDGYPRSIEQMDSLEKFLQDDKTVVLKSVIEVKVTKQTAKERVLGRARGADDDVQVFNNRMQVYLKPLQKIQAYYKDKELLHVISGEKSIEDVVQELQIFIESHI